MESPWRIEKTECGSGFNFWVGPPGVPGSVCVKGLSRQQGEDLGTAAIELSRRVEFRALENVRDALGIKAV